MAHPYKYIYTSKILMILDLIVHLVQITQGT